MTTVFQSISDPSDLDAVRAAIAEGPRPERLVPLDMSRLVIDRQAVDRVSRTLRDLVPADIERPRVTVIVDRTRILRDGVDLKDLLVSELSERFELRLSPLGDEHHLFVDDRALADATEASTGSDAILTIGSGTVSDIGKVASANTGGTPLVTLQTAASVDGYTDNVSVVLKSGVKRTVPSRWPDAVLADLTTIATAPVELNTAGFGELLSLFTAPADWELAALCGLDDTFHETPRDLLFAFVDDPREWADGVDRGEIASVEQLTRALAIRGIGTGIAGTTACLSGVEHLVSHMLDMHAGARGLEVGKHGAQVGAASVVGATIWRVFSERLAAGAPAVSAPDLAEAEGAVRAAFGHLDGEGSLAAECWSDYSAKLRAVSERLGDIEGAIAGISAEQGLLQRLPDPEMLAQSLVLAGSPVDRGALEPWVDADVWTWAIRNCHMMRNRFTVIDLMQLLGWWDDAAVDEVLSRAAGIVEEARR